MAIKQLIYSHKIYSILISFFNITSNEYIELLISNTCLHLCLLDGHSSKHILEYLFFYALLNLNNFV